MFWSVVALGLVTALENELLQPEECEVLLFNPYIISVFSKKGVDKDIVQIIDEGREFDDIKRLIPQCYDEAVLKTKLKILSYIKNHDIIEYPIERYFENNN